MKNRIEAQIKTIWNLPLCIAASLFISLSSAVMAATNATTPITNSGTTFSPATLSIGSIDTVSFTLASIHNAVEVSKATYDASGTTALSGGFSTAFGPTGVKVSGLTAGTHYYVCTNHAGIGMKGQIIVQAPNALKTGSKNFTSFKFQIAGINPISLKMQGETGKISVVDIKGRVIWSTLVKKNDVQNLHWDRKLADGGNIAEGAYFVQLTSLDAEEKLTGKPFQTLIQLR